MSKRKHFFVAVAVGLSSAAGAARSAPMGTAFTFQGYLERPLGTPLTDTCDFRFGLWDAAAGGEQKGSSPQTKMGVAVADGVVTIARLDFGPGAIDGNARWLEIEVQCHGDDDFVKLEPRVELTPVPHALALPGLYTQENAISPNIIGGYSGNSITPGVAGATIAGGGDATFPNQVTDAYGTVGGGQSNTASGPNSTIGGGNANSTGGGYSTVGGGAGNHASAECSFVGGGAFNDAIAGNSTVGGGLENTASGGGSFVGGGVYNYAIGGNSTVGGGWSNQATGSNSNVGGGYYHGASGNNSTIPGGYYNAAGGDYSIVGGGQGNSATNAWSTVGGGLNNQATGFSSIVAGGDDNNATRSSATVGGGNTNTASGSSSTVGGGSSNTASGDTSTVGGGYDNSASGSDSTVGGGWGNTASGNYSTVGGGYINTASNNLSTVGGGYINTASGSESTVGGGNQNTASGLYATVPGGYSNEAGGSYSFAAGRRSHVRSVAAGDPATDDGTFIWADSFDGDFVSTGANKFLVRASGGTTIYSNTALNAGVTLAAGGNAWAAVSDRNLKDNFQAVDARELLQRLVSVPMTTWNYKSQDASIRHIGVMAQDFYAAFGVGEEETKITTIDADGVAFAAIQGLYEVVKDKECRIDELEGQKAALEARVAALEAMMARIVEVQNGGAR